MPRHSEGNHPKYFPLRSTLCVCVWVHDSCFWGQSDKLTDKLSAPEQSPKHTRCVCVGKCEWESHSENNWICARWRDEEGEKVMQCTSFGYINTSAFFFKTHNFCYAWRLHYSSIFNPRKWRLSKTLPRFSLKTPGLHYNVNGPKRRLLKTMVWLPTFALRILGDRVNNNIMLIVVPAWMVMWHTFLIVSEMQWKLQCRRGSFLFLIAVLKWKRTSVNVALDSRV